MVSHGQARRLYDHSCRFEQRPEIGIHQLQTSATGMVHAADYLLGMHQSALEP